MNISELHTPVFRDRCLDILAPALDRDGAVLVDCTLGLAGHTEAALNRFPSLRVIGIDRDPQARGFAAERLARFGDRVSIVAAVYNEIDLVLAAQNLASVDGILFDLGVSSLQLDSVDRGFAYSKSAPLDMRMDPKLDLTAADIIAEYSVAELTRVFQDWGEEKLALRYARAIVNARDIAAVKNSDQLNQIITEATPQALRRQGHVAKRVYQALRIEVNQELSIWQDALPKALHALRVGGRIVVLSYHSLEDRITKLELNERSQSTAPLGLPVELPEHAPEFKLLVRGAVLANEQEKAENPRATSVRLRAAEKLRLV